MLLARLSLLQRTPYRGNLSPKPSNIEIMLERQAAIAAPGFTTSVRLPSRAHWKTENTA
jgi:hypothetical protein